MPDTADVLDLIDAAVTDYAAGWPDAVRYNAPPLAPSQCTFSLCDARIIIGTALLTSITALLESFTAMMNEGHESMLLTSRAFGLKPHCLGLTSCACHPSPFPAARDYRRRTKHRNRRHR